MGIKNLKILYASTCPFLNTGYGKCTRYIVKGLREKGLDIILYCPQVVSGKLTWEDIQILPALSSRAYDPNDIIKWFWSFNRNLVITHFDLWALTGLTRVPITWVPYTPIDAPLDEYTWEINDVLLADNVVAVIAQSKFGFNEIKKVVKDRKPVFYIPHGVDTKIYKPIPQELKPIVRQRLNLPSEAFLLGFVGLNRSDRKDIVGLLKAFKLFIENFRDAARDTYLMLWTNIDPEPGHSYDIPRLCKRYGIDNKVLLIPRQLQPPDLFLDEHYLATVLACLDWYVTMSSGEGFGLPVLESLACGVPVLAPHNSSHVELVVDTSEFPYPRGLTVKPRWVRPVLWTPTHQEYSFVDPWDFAQAINYIYNLGTPKQLSKWCREFATRYDWKIIIERYWLPVLEKIASEVLRL